MDNNEPIKLLGLSPPKEGLLMFEDLAAEIFTKLLLKTSLRISADSFYYYKSGSDGELLQDLRRFPPRVENFRFIGVFDGDCIGKYERQLRGLENYVYLPEPIAPEEILIAFIKITDVHRVAVVLGITDDALIDAKEAAAGSDHHDYFHVFSGRLGRDFGEIFAKICARWIAETNNAAKVNIFVKSIEDIFNGIQE